MKLLNWLFGRDKEIKKQTQVKEMEVYTGNVDQNAVKFALEKQSNGDIAVIAVDASGKKLLCGNIMYFKTMSDGEIVFERAGAVTDAIKHNGKYGALRSYTAYKNAKEREAEAKADEENEALYLEFRKLKAKYPHADLDIM